MTPIQAFALGVAVGALAALAALLEHITGPEWTPPQTRRQHARCEDCDGVCLVTLDGRCATCGSGSVWTRQ